MLKTFSKMIGLLPQPEGDGVALTPSALASFPIPAAIIRKNGEQAACNAPGAHFLGMIDLPGSEAVQSLIERVRETGRSLNESVIFPSEQGDLYYDFSLLPIEPDSVLVLARDVTLESNLRSTLIESRQRYKDLIEISSDFIWEINEAGVFVFVSPKGALGHPADHIVDRPVADFLAQDRIREGLVPFTSGKPVEDVEIWMEDAAGDLRCFLTASSPLLDFSGVRRGARGICRDVTELKKQELALQKANNRERLLTYIMRMVRDVVDPTDMLKAAAESTARALRASGCEIFRLQNGRMVLSASFGQIGCHDEIIDSLPDDAIREYSIGRKRALTSLSRYHRDVNGALILWRDESEPRWDDDSYLLLEDVASQIGVANRQIANHERILNLSRTDSLTGLYNRRAFFEELARRFARLAWDKRPAALVYLDLDNFKLVNDLFGHRRGDEALLAVRDILLKYSRPTDLTARLGGDEFALWLEGAEAHIAQKRCQNILDATKNLSHFSGDVDNPLAMSLGIAIYSPDRKESLQDLISRADDAMYQAKHSGKGSFRLAEPAQEE